MHGKSIGGTETFQKVKSNWLYHQRQKCCYIQVALILQEPIDISPGIELLTTPSAEKAKSALTGEEWGCMCHFGFPKWRYPLQRVGPSPLPLGLWDLLLMLHHHQAELWVLWRWSSADPTVFGDEATLRAGGETQPANHHSIWFLTNLKENGSSKTTKNSHIPLSLYSHFFS